MEKELISVVIPCYNRADVIMPCLESVLDQSYENIEVIISDDGSTDGTEKLFENFSDPRVRYIRYTPNMGACHARNYGAEHSRGEYIAFQDSDDFWHRDKLLKQHAHIKRCGADFVFCGMNRVSPKGKQYFYPVHPFDDKGDALTQFLLENRAGTQTMLMRREVWEKVRFDESFRRYQDWDFALRIAAAGYKMSFLNEALADSAVGSSSISATVNSFPALEHLYAAHREEFDSRPACLARLYRRMARRLKHSEPLSAAEYFSKSYRIEKRTGDLVGNILCRIRAILRR